METPNKLAMPAPISRRRVYLNRWESLKRERDESWTPHWRELSEYIQPRKSRFLLNDRNKGQKRNEKVINSKPTRAAGRLAAGMMAGITSPARPWLRLTTSDPRLADTGAAKSWLHTVEETIRTTFAKSNLYNKLHEVYAALAVPGTATLHVDDDLEDVVRGYVFPIGQYALANNARLAVDTIYREFSMTTGQLVEAFGQEKVSDTVRRQFTENRLDEWHGVLHVIEPNRMRREPGAAGYQSMAFSSCWMEVAGSDDIGFLRESGYEENPCMAVRWDVTGEDVYGSSPGMEALGDCRALQLLERRKAQVVDKIVDPPMNAPSSMIGRKTSLMPGATNFVDALNPTQTFAPSIQINSQALQAIELTIREHEQRIDSSFFVDLWLALTESEGTMTAREVAERHEEKLLQLGPVMERLADELLDPLVYRVFAVLMRKGLLPPPPREMQGQELRIEYISILAQAQKLVSTSGIERLAAFTGNLAAANKEVLDKLNFDKVVDEYANAVGTKPDLVRTDEEVAMIRQERQQQMAQMQAMEQAGAAVQGAKVLSETDLQGDNALNRLLGSLGGAAASGVPS